MKKNVNQIKKCIIGTVAKTILFLGLIILLTNLISYAQLNYSASWLGNTYNGERWMPVYSSVIDVTSDGTVSSINGWDEAARCVTVYDKDGLQFNDFDFSFGGSNFLPFVPDSSRGICPGYGTAGEAIAMDSLYMYMGQCEGRIVMWDRKEKFKYLKSPKKGFSLRGMFVKNKMLYTINYKGTVNIYESPSLNLIRSFQAVPDSSYDAKRIVCDLQGNIWVLAKNSIKKFTSTGVPIPAHDIILTDPASLAIDNNGNLIVAENGNRRQVLFYNIAGQPQLIKTFGILGGVAAGIKGDIKDQPTKLFEISTAKTDAKGNLYVSMSRYGQKFILRKFDISSQLLWENYNLVFTESVDFDYSKDGEYMYSADGKFEMDYTKSAGNEAKLVSFTRDDYSYPKDKRVVDQTKTTCVQFRNINNNRLLFLSGMFPGSMKVYYYDQEIAIDSKLEFGENTFVTFPDAEGNVWYMKNTNLTKIYKQSLIGFNSIGVPVYSEPTSFDVPADFFEANNKTSTNVERLYYNPKTDEMYLAGYTLQNPKFQNSSWGNFREIVKYKNWSTINRAVSTRILLPYTGGTSIAPKSMTVAGEYVFVGNVGDSRNGIIYIYNAATGVAVGNLAPKMPVQHDVGWLDIPYAINAIKRSNGEYVVSLEDNYRGKNILYRWCPEGNCAESGVAISLSSPVYNAFYKTGSAIQFKANITANVNLVEKVKYYANDSLLGESAPNTTFTWNNPIAGKLFVKAIAFTFDGKKKATSEIKIIVGSSRTANIESPSMSQTLNILSDIEFSISTNDVSNVSSVCYVVNNQNIGCGAANDAYRKKSLLTAGAKNVYAIVTYTNNEVVNTPVKLAEVKGIDVQKQVYLDVNSKYTLNAFIENTSLVVDTALFNYSTENASIANVSSKGIISSGTVLGATRVFVYSKNLVYKDTVLVYVCGVTKFTGLKIGTLGSYDGTSTFDKAQDGDISTYFSSNLPSGAWTGIDVGTNADNLLTRIKYSPRPGFAFRLLNGKIQGSNDASFSSFENLFTINLVKDDNWVTAEVNNTSKYRYLRFVSPDDGYCNIGEIEFWGTTKCNTVLSTNSLDENTSVTEVNVMPNPTSSTITVSSLLNISNIVVYDSQGSVIESLNSGKNKISIGEHYPTGIYFMNIRLENNTIHVEKFIKY